MGALPRLEQGGTTFHLYIDGRVVGSLKRGTYFKVQHPPGKVRISLAIDFSTPPPAAESNYGDITVDLEGGSDVYLQTEYVGRRKDPPLVQVDPAIGSATMAGYKERPAALHVSR